MCEVMNVRWIALKKKSCTHCDLSFFRIFQSDHEKLLLLGICLLK